ncbi:hypothetical protein DBV15_05612 [Temnothorax longispinosus]|uniref:Uncharacterized protein n=1 Tax=Temnothorax longispinosus TaxID=300112 RepID=A0A4S2JZE8_9HYME|nr:hypothetical protein DBV15_05612 [Temnothorax longispinosus]
MPLMGVSANRSFKLEKRNVSGISTKKKLESADVERIKRTERIPPLAPPTRYFHSRRIFSRQIDCAAVYPTSIGFCRFAAIPDASAMRGRLLGACRHYGCCRRAPD